MNSITLTSSMLTATSVGEDFFRVMDVSRHRKIDTLRGYVRRRYSSSVLERGL